jgi:hypothetical protein
MRRGIRMGRAWAVLGLMAAGVLGLPSVVAAQTASQAKVVQATTAGTTVLGITLPGTTTVLADTGALPRAVTGALQASSDSGSVPALLGGDSLHATVIGLPESVASEASLGSLGISLPGIAISADLLMARALAVAGVGGSGDSEIEGLSINGVRVPVSGAPNQTVPVPGGVVVINEQQTGAAGSLVSALHVKVNGVADIVVASASAVTP